MWAGFVVAMPAESLADTLAAVMPVAHADTPAVAQQAEDSVAEQAVAEPTLAAAAAVVVAAEAAAAGANQP